METRILDYMMEKDTARLRSVMERRVIMYLADERVSGTVKIDNTWLIPKDAVKPADGCKSNERKSEARKEVV